MLTARKYKENIVLIHTSISQDDYGKGVTTEKLDVFNTFAAVTQTGNGRVRIENTNAQQESFRFVIRYTDVEFNGVRWKGKEYVVSSTENVNQANTELVIYAQRAE